MASARKKLLLFPPMQTYPGTLVQVVEGGITSSSFAANAISAAAFSQAAADKVWATAVRSLTDKADFSLTAGSYSVRASSTQRATISQIDTQNNQAATIASVTVTRAFLAGTTSGDQTANSSAVLGLAVLTNATTVTATRLNITGRNDVRFDLVELF